MRNRSPIHLESFFVLVAHDGGNPLEIGNDDMDGIFKDIPDRDPVLAGTFHTDVLAVVVKEPLLEVKQPTIIGGEALLLVLGKDAVGCSDDCGDEKGLVHIDAATDRVNHLFFRMLNENKAREDRYNATISQLSDNIVRIINHIQDQLDVVLDNNDNHKEGK